MAYSDAQRMEAMIRLAINKYNYDLTADQMGITARTLRNWEKNFPKKGVPELLDRAIERMLMSIPDKWGGQDWAIALGILMDKWLLVHGQPTSRIENIFNQLEKLSNDELDTIIREFETAASRGLSGESDQGKPQQVADITDTT